MRQVMASSWGAWQWVGVETLIAASGWAAGTGMRAVLARVAHVPQIRSPVVPVVIASLWVVAVARGVSGGLPLWWLPVPMALACLGVPLVVADLTCRHLPDRLTLAAYPVFSALLVVMGLVTADACIGERGLLGVILFGGLHLLARAVSRGSLGAGDVKLAGGIGAPVGVLGLPALAVCALTAAVVTVGAAGCARLVGFRRWRHGVPHGPGMLAAAWVLVTFPGSGLPMPP